ncbi:DDE superfamily endonuclease [Streptomyces sp. BK340]|nr:DDE superfamily endonuclease [Streptomyces sp. BK340]
MLVIDEPGDLKKGIATVGVQRRYTGAGRIENGQVAVQLTYLTPRGHAAIDRELYVPRSWTQDTARCRAAGIPDNAGFATKPALAARLIGSVLEGRQIGCVLAVACDDQIITRAGKFRADVLVKKLPDRLRRSEW